MKLIQFSRKKNIYHNFYGLQVVMVLGAGRGPLVRATLRVSLQV